MWVGKVNELIGSSNESFEDAVAGVLERANRTLRGITEISVVEKRIRIVDDRIAEYRVRLRLGFDMVPEHRQHR